MRKTVTKSAFVLLALMLAYETQALVPYEPKPPAKKKMEKDYEQKLFKWDSEAVLGLLTARLRILSFFAREEPTKEQIQALELLRSVIHEHTKDIVVGVYQCAKDDSLFKCDDKGEVFPRFKYWDRTKKEVTYPLEPNMSFAELVVKTKELIVPEQKILKSKDELENFLKTNKHAMVANIDSKDSEQAAVLNELVKASKFESSMVFDIAKVEATDLEAEFPAYKEKGIHFHTINSEGENIFKKYPYNLENHDEIVASIISFFEMESYPDVFFFNSTLFNDIFANHINTQFIYFTTDPESAKTKEAVKILKKASKFNKQEDLLSQRIAFVVFKIGLNPGVEASFSNLQDGDAFLTHVGDDNFFRYKYANPFLTKSNIKEFIEDFRAGRIPEYLISEPVQEKDLYLAESNVLVVTGDEYREKIIRSKDNFIVMFCSSPEACEVSLSSYKLLSKKTDSGILRFAYVNAEKNEVRGIHHRRFPNFILYVNGHKAQPKVYDLDLDFPTLTGWLNTYAPGVKIDIDHETIFENYYSTRSPEEKAKIQEAITNKAYDIPNVSSEFIATVIAKYGAKEAESSKSDL